MNFLLIIQILVSLGLIFSILIQANGTSIGRSFGGLGGSYHTKKGAEKALFSFTIFLSIVYIALSLLNLRF